MDSISNGGVAINTNPMAPIKGISRDVIDPSEDSGFSSISHSSDPSVVTVKSETNLNDSSIGNGINFVDPTLLEEKIRLKEEEKLRKQRVDTQSLLEKRLEKEAHEKEIQEKQYKCLMHLLNQSKALSNFILKKDDNKENSDKRRKRKGAKIDTTEDDASEKPPPAKRGRKPKNPAPAVKPASKRGRKKLNLSEEDIKEELESMSDEETNTKEETKPKTNFVQPKFFQGELRDYQKDGLNWLKLLDENGLNGILADEMGLGKTIQVIALIAYLMEKQVPGPYMIVVPLSTLPNWESEFKRFAPQVPVVVYYGNKADRKTISKKLSRKTRITPTFSTYPVVLMTFQMPLFDAHELRAYNWRYIIIDEAQRIKNYESLLFKILKSYNSVNRLLLTGTPLQNNLTELWSLLNFLLPDIFYDLDVFQSWFNAKEVQNEEGQKKFFRQEQEKQVLSTLREILQPFMLRRIKEDVCPEIPPLKEVVVNTPMTKLQFELYTAILNRDIAKLHRVKDESLIIDDIDGKRPKRKCTKKINLESYYVDDSIDRSSSSIVSSSSFVGASSEKKIDKEAEQLSMWNEFTSVTEETSDYLIRLRFGNDVMMYRHVVNHPYIIHYPMNDCGLGKVDENLVKASGKILVLDAMLKRLHKDGHKVLLFSTMTMVLDVIEDYLSMQDYQYVRIDGTIKYDNRKQNIDCFQNDPEVFLFLMTTKSGGVGLNLAAADTVIIYDSDWNPQNDIQAMARCHRIGQTKPVVVYRLCTKGTVDEEIIKRANAKRFLEKAVISKETSLVSSEEGLMKLKKLLEENTCKIVDSKNSVYTDNELDQLLDRSDMISIQSA